MHPSPPPQLLDVTLSMIQNEPLIIITTRSNNSYILTTN